MFSNGENSKYINLNFKEPPDEPNGFISVEDIESLLEQWNKGILYSTSKKSNQEFLDFIRPLADEICRGNLEAEIKTLFEKRDSINKKIGRLEKSLSYYLKSNNKE